MMRVRNLHVSPLIIVHKYMVQYANELTEKGKKSGAKNVTVSHVIDLMARECLSSKYPELRKFFEMQDGIQDQVEEIRKEQTGKRRKK